MKRLVDQEDLEGDDQRLAELLRAAVPLDLNVLRRRLVWLRIQRRTAAPACQGLPCVLPPRGPD